MGDAGSPLPKLGPNGPPQKEVTVLVTGFGVSHETSLSLSTPTEHALLQQKTSSSAQLS